jgi:hypothetical protein
MYGAAYRWSKSASRSSHFIPSERFRRSPVIVYVDLMVVTNDVTRTEIPAVVENRTPVFTSQAELFVVGNSGGGRNFRRILRMNYHGL